MDINPETTYDETNLLNKCRACILNIGVVPILSEYGQEKINLGEIFETYSGVNVNEIEKLPKSLCHDCLNSLIFVHKFITKCKTTQAILQAVCSSKEPTSCIVVLTNGWNDISPEVDTEAVEEHLPEAIAISDFIDANNVSDAAEEFDYDIEKSSTVSDVSVNSNESKILLSHNKLKIPLLDVTDVSNDTFQVEEENRLSDSNEQVEAKDANIFIDTVLNDFSTDELEETIDVKYQLPDLLNNSTETTTEENTDSKEEVFQNNKTCSICFKRFKFRAALRYHLRLHPKEKLLEKPYQCKICSFRLSSNRNLIKHIHRVHADAKPYVCDICNEAFKLFRALRNHKKLHKEHRNPVPARNLLCSYCGLVLSNYKKYKEHLFDIHGEAALENENEPMQHTCEICYNTFSTKGGLKSHMDIHSGTRKFLCNYCGKTFTLASGLRIHLVVHTGERRFKCEVCGKTFNQGAALRSHRFSHTGIRPYKCQMCPKSFKMPQQLNYHTLTHTGEKPHTCTYCGKGFALKGNLKQHMASHTDETPYSCSYCNRAFKSTKNLKLHIKRHEKDQI